MVKNYKKFAYDALIGQCDIDLYTIYLSPRHVMINNWYALTTKNIDHNQITGYIKLSIQIVHK